MGSMQGDEHFYSNKNCVFVLMRIWKKNKVVHWMYDSIAVIAEGKAICSEKYNNSI